jgi:hypothetical protein
VVVDDEIAAEEEQQPAPQGRASRLAALLKPPPRRGPVRIAPMGDAAKRAAVLNLDGTERKVGLIGAALAAVLAFSAAMPGVLNPKTTKVTQSIAALKNKTCIAGFTYDTSTKQCTGKGTLSFDHWIVELVLLLAFALAIFIATRFGRRGPVGFTLLMAGLAFEAYLGILGVVFIAGGGWLLIRAWRTQRYGSPTATKANPTGERRPAPARAERPARAKKGKEPERTGPEASKRYTPKKAKKKRPAATTPPAS